MKIRECIDRVDNYKPNKFSEEDKVLWLSNFDNSIYIDIICTHRYNRCEEPIEFKPYTVDNMEKEMIVPAPYDEVYERYLSMMIDDKNEDIANYNNSRVMYEAAYHAFAAHYNKYHMPIGTGMKIWG